MILEAQALSFYTKILFHVGPPLQRTAKGTHSLPFMKLLLFRHRIMNISKKIWLKRIKMFLCKK